MLAQLPAGFETFTLDDRWFWTGTYREAYGPFPDVETATNHAKETAWQDEEDRREYERETPYGAMFGIVVSLGMMLALGLAVYVILRAIHVL